MPGTNLTQDEAAERAALLRVESYTIDLDLSTNGDTYRSETTIRFTANQAGSTSFVDLVAPSVREIVLNGRSLDPSVYADSRITITDLADHNELRVVADCAYMNTGEGLHRSVDPADGNTYLYTHFEMPEARRVYASFEQPDLKASFAFTITAPAEWVVLSNSPTPVPVAVRDGVARWQFQPTARISTYLTALAAGPYHMVWDRYVGKSGQVVPLGVACRASLAGHLDADEIFEVTKQGFDYFIAAFDQPYPFDKYDQIFVPEYNLGAMENVGLVTIAEGYLFRSRVTDASHQFRAETVLHELAHMWFGDLVTMRWWNDLWLKESFATYMASRCQADATRWPQAWTVVANTDKAWAIRQDQLPSTHPIVATITDLEDVQLNFDGITYAKGAAVLKQLVAWVGSEAFFAGVRAYFKRHAWGVTTLSDLLVALENASGRDLTAWGSQWLQTTGPNTLRPSYTLAQDGTFASFTVRQEGTTLRSHRIAIGLYSGSPLHRVRRVELDISGPETPVSELVGAPRPDLVLLNDDDLTYATLRLDEHSLSTVVSRMGELDDSLARAVLWSATWDMVRNAELAGRDFISMALRGIADETDMTVVLTLNMHVLTTVDFYVDPAFRSATAREIATAARDGLTAAEPGGDRQLAWARLFGRTACAEDDLSFISDLLAGRTTVSGLAIDTDLRWALFAALARNGKVSAAEIDSELDRDRTTAGEENAAGARAALPTAAAKAAAWAAVIDRTDLPNRTQDAIIGGRYGSSFIGLGFVQAGQRDLMVPYVDRYFAMLDDVWRTRTLEIARTIVSGLYPKLIVGPETVAATDAYLASSDVPAGLRRLLVEARDDVVRALAAQARDRSSS